MEVAVVEKETVVVAVAARHLHQHHFLAELPDRLGARRQRVQFLDGDRPLLRALHLAVLPDRFVHLGVAWRRRWR